MKKTTTKKPRPAEAEQAGMEERNREEKESAGQALHFNRTSSALEVP